MNPEIQSESSPGLTPLITGIVGDVASPQPVEWKTDNFGVFFQLSLRMGPYSVLDVH